MKSNRIKEVESLYQQYPTLQNCESKLIEIDSQIADISNKTVSEYHNNHELFQSDQEKLKELESAKKAIERFIHFMKNKSQQIQRFHTKGKSLKQNLNALDPFEQETEEESALQLKMMDSVMKEIEKVNRVLNYFNDKKSVTGIIGENLAENKNNIKDLLASFFEDRNEGIIDQQKKSETKLSEREKQLMAVYANTSKEEQRIWLASKEYKTLRTNFVSKLYNVDESKKVFLETEFVKCIGNPEAMQKLIDNIDFYKYDESGIVDTLRNATRHNKFDSNTDLKHISSIFLPDSEHMRSFLDKVLIFSKNKILSLLNNGQVEDIKYALPSYAYLLLFTAGKLGEIDNNEFLNIISFNNYNHYFNFAEIEKNGTRQSQNSFQRLAQTPDIKIMLEAKMREILTDLLPALNTHYGQKSTIVDNNMLSDLGLRKNTNTNSIELVAPTEKEKTVNMLSQTLFVQSHQENEKIKNTLIKKREALSSSLFVDSAKKYDDYSNEISQGNIPADIPLELILKQSLEIIKKIQTNFYRINKMLTIEHKGSFSQQSSFSRFTECEKNLEKIEKTIAEYQAVLKEKLVFSKKKITLKSEAKRNLESCLDYELEMKASREKYLRTIKADFYLPDDLNNSEEILQYVNAMADTQAVLKDNFIRLREQHKNLFNQMETLFDELVDVNTKLKQNYSISSGKDKQIKDFDLQSFNLPVNYMYNLL